MEQTQLVIGLETGKVKPMQMLEGRFGVAGGQEVREFVFTDRGTFKKGEGWKKKVILGKRSQCVPCLNKLSGSTVEPQLSHLTPEHQQSANSYEDLSILAELSCQQPGNPKQSQGCISAAFHLTFNDICIKERLSKGFSHVDEREDRKPADDEEQQT